MCRSGQETFHWSQDNAIEMRRKRHNAFQGELVFDEADGTTEVDECVDCFSQSPRSNYDYKLNSFVAVQDNHNRDDAFLFGKNIYDVRD